MWMYTLYFVALQAFLCTGYKYFVVRSRYLHMNTYAKNTTMHSIKLTESYV